MLPYMYTFCCLIWKRDFSASYTCFVVEGAPLAENFWENTGFFTQPAAGGKIRRFLGSKWCHIYTFWVFFEIKMLPYIHIFFLWSKCCKIYTFSSVFGQNATIYIHILGSKCCNIYTFVSFFGVKMLPYIHIFCLFVFGQNAATYTYLCLFLGSKCYYIYTFWGFFLGQNAAIYTRFWNLIFSEKTKKKKNNSTSVVLSN